MKQYAGIGMKKRNNQRRHGNLVLADIVDEDYVVNTRAQSMSSAIFGANALFTKPGQSLAPGL